MKTILDKIAASATAAIVFFVSIVMAGLGFAVMGILALFALASFGLAMIIAPFVAKQEKHDVEDAEVEDITMPEEPAKAS